MHDPIFDELDAWGEGITDHVRCHGIQDIYFKKMDHDDTNDETDIDGLVRKNLFVLCKGFFPRVFWNQH